jgi:hypothetical protein
MSLLRNLRPETWILLAAVIFMLVLAIDAVTPDGNGGAPGKGIAMVTPAPTGMVAGQAPVEAQAQTVARLQPIQAQVFTYSGVVDQFVNRDPGGWGQVHVVVNDGAGMVQDVSLGPEWYLSFQGCVVRRGIHVDGEGFHFDGLTQGGVLYAKNLNVNGVHCRLRNNQGLALWTDQLR